MSKKLGLPGYRASAESAMVGRDIVLAKETGGHLHVDHIGYALTVDLVRFAKSWGAHVTSECTAHHFSLTEAEMEVSGTNAKINPPLASEADVAAVKAGLKDGTIDVIISDHAPYTVEEKARGFEKAPFGLIGLETTLAAAMTYLVDNGTLSLSETLAKLTINPARILYGVDRGHLSIGAVADITIFDLCSTWIPDSSKYQSKSRNCPFHGKQMKGRTIHTIVDGKFVVRDGVLVK
jgi:dihydroorotase